MVDTFSNADADIPECENNKELASTLQNIAHVKDNGYLENCGDKANAREDGVSAVAWNFA